MTAEFFSRVPELKGKRITLKRILAESAEDLKKLAESVNVYKYLPTFLFEQKYDIKTVMERLYTECIDESLILGIYKDGEFCGIAEMYGLKEHINKVSVGYRLPERFWGQGIASEALGLMADYLINKAGIEIITASSMVENTGSASVLIKNGFTHVVHGVYEDWGFDEPVLVDKWIR